MQMRRIRAISSIEEQLKLLLFDGISRRIRAISSIEEQLKLLSFDGIHCTCPYNWNFPRRLNAIDTLVSNGAPCPLEAAIYSKPSPLTGGWLVRSLVLIASILQKMTTLRITGSVIFLVFAVTTAYPPGTPEDIVPEDLKELTDTPEAKIDTTVSETALTGACHVHTRIWTCVILSPRDSFAVSIRLELHRVAHAESHAEIHERRTSPCDHHN